MISLIACDIDGTLLHGTETKIAPRVFEEIRRLQGKGVLFCPASGRQYHSLENLFAPVSRSLHFLCENGAAIFAPGGKLLCKTPFQREFAMKLSWKIMENPDCEVFISGQNTTYLCPKTPEIVDRTMNFTGNNVCIVSSPDEVPEEIIKVSAYCNRGAVAEKENLSFPWAAHAGPTVAGEKWLDFTLSTKGTGIRQLCEILGIDPGDVMAIGDNDNDTAMLDAVGHPYIMENAAPHLLEKYSNHCRRVEELLARL